MKRETLAATSPAPTGRTFIVSVLIRVPETPETDHPDAAAESVFSWLRTRIGAPDPEHADPAAFPWSVESVRPSRRKGAR